MNKTEIEDTVKYNKTVANFSAIIQLADAQNGKRYFPHYFTPCLLNNRDSKQATRQLHTYIQQYWPEKFIIYCKLRVNNEDISEFHIPMIQDCELLERCLHGIVDSANAILENYLNVVHGLLR